MCVYTEAQGQTECSQVTSSLCETYETCGVLRALRALTILGLLVSAAHLSVLWLLPKRVSRRRSALYSAILADLAALFLFINVFLSFAFRDNVSDKLRKRAHLGSCVYLSLAAALFLSASAFCLFIVARRRPRRFSMSVQALRRSRLAAISRHEEENPRYTGDYEPLDVSDVLSSDIAATKESIVALTTFRPSPSLTAQASMGAQSTSASASNTTSGSGRGSLPRIRPPVLTPAPIPEAPEESSAAEEET